MVRISMVSDATTNNSRKGTGGKVDGLRTASADAFPVVVKVSAAVVALPDGVIEFGVTVHVDKAGAPEHVSEIVWL